MIKGCNYEFINKMGSYYKLTNPNAKIVNYLYRTDDLKLDSNNSYTNYQIAVTFNGEDYLAISISSEMVVEKLLTGWTSERVIPTF